MKVLIKFVWFYRGDIWRLVPELKKSFFLLCDVIITFLVLGPATSIEISFPTVAMAVCSLDLEALWPKCAQAAPGGRARNHRTIQLFSVQYNFILYSECCNLIGWCKLEWEYIRLLNLMRTRTLCYCECWVAQSAIGEVPFLKYWPTSVNDLSSNLTVSLRT